MEILDVGGCRIGVKKWVDVGVMVIGCLMEGKNWVVYIIKGFKGSVLGVI